MTSSASPLPIAFALPLRLVNGLNVRENHFVRARRAKQQRGIVCLSVRTRLNGSPLPASIVVTIVRVGPRKLDDDGSVASAKHVRDGVADALGIDDGNERVRYVYRQEAGPHGVRIEIAAASG